MSRSFVSFYIPGSHSSSAGLLRLTAADLCSPQYQEELFWLAASVGLPKSVVGKRVFSNFCFSSGRRFQPQ